MRLRQLFIISRGTKVVLTITFSVSFLAVLFAFFYYRSINNSEDPRIRRTRELLAEFEKISESNNRFNSFPLLDSAGTLLRAYPDYESSFEVGVIYNNKCSTLLLMALYDSTITEPEKRTLLDLSMKFCDSSITNYNRWISTWGNLSADSIATRISPFMKEDDPAFAGLNFRKILSRRIKNIVMAQVETPRRLSVSLTNKGTIYRHLLMPDSAQIYYNQAISLWGDNRIAKSNLNVLFGGEAIRPSLIESLFPPDKNKK